MAKVKAAHELTNRGLAHRVLEQVNKIRMALAIGEKKLDRLPKAIKGDSRQCVLARALSNGWEADIGGDASMELIHDVEGIDWDAALEAMHNLGFGSARIDHRPGNKRRGRPAKIAIHFTATPEMDELIDRFDSGLMQHLVLND